MWSLSRDYIRWIADCDHGHHLLVDLIDVQLGVPSFKRPTIAAQLVEAVWRVDRLMLGVESK